MRPNYLKKFRKVFFFSSEIWEIDIEDQECYNFFTKKSWSRKYKYNLEIIYRENGGIENAVLYKCAKGGNSDMALNSYFDFAENDFQHFKASYDAGMLDSNTKLFV